MVVLIGLAFLHPLWTRSGIVYSKHSDIIAEHASLKALGQRSIAAEGRFPLWNPYMNGGSPAFASPESMYLFPFDLLYLILPLGPATNGVILLNFLLAGVAMYVFARRTWDDPACGIFCGVAYMLSYRYLAMIHAGWLPKMTMYALTPLVFWSCDRLMERPGLHRTAVLAVIAALCLIQSDMQQLYYGGLGCLIFVLVRFRSSGWRTALQGASALVCGGIVGLAISAPILLPRAEFAALSSRAEPTYGFFLSQPPTHGDLKTLADPLDEGGNRDEFWEKNFYFGLWLYPLCLLAATREPRRSCPILAAFLVMVLLCFDTPLLRFLYVCLPGFSLFRQSHRVLLLAQFALVVLGAIGARTLGAEVSARRVPWLAVALMLATAAGGLWAGRKMGTGHSYAVSAVAALVGVALLPVVRVPRLLTGLLCLLPIADAGIRVGSRTTVVPIEQALPRHAFHDVLKARDDGGRTAAIGRTAIPYGMAALYEVELVNGFAALNLKHYVEYFGTLQFGDPNRAPKGPWVWTDLSAVTKPEMLRALDVEYLIANPLYSFDPIGYEKVAGFSDVPVFSLYEGIIRVPIHIWRLRDRLGPAYFATSVRPVPDERASLRAIAAAASVLDAYVLGMELEPDDLGHAGGTARLARRDLDEYEYEVRSQGRNFLIVSHVWYPGWRATLDGKPIRLYRTNHALMGCVIPDGSHRLVLTMTSPPLWRGLLIAGAGVPVLACLIGVPLLRRARTRKRLTT
mgnify:CR=1 FL=1